MASYVLDCACGCGTFEAQRPHAKWKTPACKKRAAATAAASGTANGQPTSGLKPLDPLEVAVRKELEAVNQLASVDGQIAIHLARQVKAATGSAASSLAQELRKVLDRATSTGSAGSDPKPPATEDDEVTKARRRREEIAAAAAAE